ncbi:MAG TPA: hypothetical protein VNI84_17395 [Pyrinomonadaceae bacterium]|nr:hypothetical protein [Pyrinomonadaceae bacterium]
MKSLLVIIMAFIIIGCAEQKPPSPPAGEIKQVVLDYLKSQPVMIATRYAVKSVNSEFRKEDVYLVTAEVDTNGTVSKRKFIASKVDNNGQKSWELIPATDTNQKNLGIYKPDAK